MFYKNCFNPKEKGEEKDSRHLQMNQSPVHFPSPVETQAAQTKQLGKVELQTDCLVNDCSSLDSDYLFMWYNINGAKKLDM